MRCGSRTHRMVDSSRVWHPRRNPPMALVSQRHRHQQQKDLPLPTQKAKPKPTMILIPIRAKTSESCWRKCLNKSATAPAGHQMYPLNRMPLLQLSLSPPPPTSSPWLPMPHSIWFRLCICIVCGHFVRAVRKHFASSLFGFFIIPSLCS